jgi:hypothetical protein
VGTNASRSPIPVATRLPPCLRLSSQLAAREAALSAREATLSGRDATLNARAAELARREEDLNLQQQRRFAATAMAPASRSTPASEEATAAPQSVRPTLLTSQQLLQQQAPPMLRIRSTGSVDGNGGRPLSSLPSSASPPCSLPSSAGSGTAPTPSSPRAQQASSQPQPLSGAKRFRSQSRRPADRLLSHGGSASAAAAGAATGDVGGSQRSDASWESGGGSGSQPQQPSSCFYAARSSVAVTVHAMPVDDEEEEEEKEGSGGGTAACSGGGGAAAGWHSTSTDAASVVENGSRGRIASLEYDADGSLLCDASQAAAVEQLPSPAASAAATAAATAFTGRQQHRYGAVPPLRYSARGPAAAAAHQPQDDGGGCSRSPWVPSGTPDDTPTTSAAGGSHSSLTPILSSLGVRCPSSASGAEENSGPGAGVWRGGSAGSGLASSSPVAAISGDGGAPAPQFAFAPLGSRASTGGGGRGLRPSAAATAAGANRLAPAATNAATSGKQQCQLTLAFRIGAPHAAAASGRPPV